jgi:hypothetical protein
MSPGSMPGGVLLYDHSPISLSMLACKVLLGYVHAVRPEKHAVPPHACLLKFFLLYWDA